MKVPASAGQSLTSFRHRVRVLVEVTDDPDEISLTAALFEDRGWPVRPARGAELHAPPLPGRSRLVVECRFNGSAKTAPQAALARILETAHKSDLQLWVRSAEVIDRPVEPVKVYYIDDAPPSWAVGHHVRHRVLQGVLRFLGVIRTIGLVQVPMSTPDTDVRAELARVNMGRPFSPSRCVLRPAAHYREPGPATPRVPFRSTSVVAVSIGAMILAVLCGEAAAATPVIWRVLLVLLGIPLAVPAGLGFAKYRRFPWWLFIGLVLSVSFSVSGLVVGLDVPHRSPLSILAMTAVIAALVVAGIGALFGFRESGLARERS
jgi:hypothetical protein